MFGSKTEEVARGWRRLHNEEVYDLYTSPDIIRVMNSRMRLVGYIACMWGLKSTC